MIKLKVEEHCHTCPEFKPAIYDKDVTAVYDGWRNIISTTVNGDIVVSCALNETCANIRNHFELMKNRF